MKLLVAYVHPEKVNEVKTALAAIDLLPVSRLPGGLPPESLDVELTLLNRIRIELTVSDYCVERAIQAIVQASRMAICGDARIFVMPAPEGSVLPGVV